MEPTVKVDAKEGVVTILQGSVLTPKYPEKINITGNIDSPRKFIEKRIGEINPLNAHFLISRELTAIALIVNEQDPYTQGRIEGKLISHPDFKKWGINSGETFTTHDLADFIKMNRSCFASKDVAMDLVVKLRAFKAKVDKEIELFKDDKANFSAKRTQVVTSNIPDSFQIVVPVFKGLQKETITVEISISPDTLNCSLISPEANDLVSKVTDTIIDSELSKILAITDKIVMIEK